jgi:hypothetical protein
MLAAIEEQIGSATVSARLPRENLSGLISLLDMLRFYAERFCRCSGLLGQMFTEIHTGNQPHHNSVRILEAESQR